MSTPGPAPKKCRPGGRPRVVIDLEKLRHINCGLGRFSLHLGRELLALADDRFEPVFFLPRGAEAWFADAAPLPGGRFGRLGVAPWRKEVVQRFYRPLIRPVMGRRAFAAWHVTNQMSRYWPLDPRVPVILTIHDLNFLHEAPHDEQFATAARKLADIQRKIDRAAVIVTDSLFVAQDVTRHLVLHNKPVHVVPLGVPLPVPASTSRPGFLPPGPFLFTVGNCLAHKNFHVLLDLLEKLPGQRLVIGGKKATPYGDYLEREVAARRLGDRVALPGEVSDADRQWLYENCEAFLFPSLTEGFGFPVLEAMLCGKPVFMSRRTSLPEIAGDHGYFFDAYDGAALAAAYWSGMGRYHSDPAAAERAREHARSFSWQRMARGYAAVYAGLLTGGLRRAA
ncbi:MAG: D-inositol 3-phosphate glycosyltransferase [Planctomycetota bacterium]|jgi:glycosyltransferase involved in cell wall biosynthesis